MLAQYFAQRGIQQVGGRVVGGASGALVGIHARHHRSFQMLGQLLGDVDGQIVLLLGIHHFDGFELVHQYTGVAYLTAAFGVERSLVQYNLIQGLVLLLHLAVAQHGCLVFRIVISHEFGSTFFQCNPVTGLHGGGITGALFLLLHFGVKLLDVGSHAVFAENQFRQVERETEGII